MNRVLTFISNKEKYISFHKLLKHKRLYGCSNIKIKIDFHNDIN